MLSDARQRARRGGLPFDLIESDITIPEVCPVLGLDLRIASGRADDHSPSLDRINPALGYVPGNVVVISNRANILKRDATVDELLLLAAFYKEIHL